MRTARCWSRQDAGRKVDFAAPGADMAAAIPGQAFGNVRGTSFASPIVAGLLAAQMKASAAPSADMATAALAAQAIDLGSLGGRSRLWQWFGWRWTACGTGCGGPYRRREEFEISQITAWEEIVSLGRR